MSNGLLKFFSILPSRERHVAVGVLILTIISIGFQVAGVGIILPFLQMVSDPGIIDDSSWLSWVYAELGFSSTRAFLIFSALSVLGLIILSNVVLAITEYTQLRLEWRIYHTLSKRLFEHYLQQDYGYFLSNNSSRLAKNVLFEIHQITSGILHPGFILVSKGIFSLVLFAFLIWVDPTVALIIGAATGLGYLITYITIQRRVKILGAEYVSANELRYKVVNEAFGGIKEVKVMEREQRFLDIYDPPTRILVRSHTKHQLFQTVPKYVIEAFAFGGLMIAFISFLIAGRDVAALVPLMGLFAFAGYRLMPALRDILVSMTTMNFHDSILDQLRNELKEKKTKDPETAGKLSFQRELRLDKVTFGYSERGSPVLENICLSIPKNKSVALVGSTGAGKSTLVDLLMGLHGTYDGEIFVDDVPLDPSSSKSLRKLIGYVPQEIFLADDTIRQNIAFGVPPDQINDEALYRAARIAHIHDFVCHDLPEGYNTIVGERGVRLSGGQRQRIGIARALYTDPEILVLDEATSDIDGKTEASISDAIDKMAGSKTLVIIAHRLSTIRQCDRIYVLEGGRIIDEGSYQDLIKHEGQFKEMAGDTKQAVIAHQTSRRE